MHNLQGLHAAPHQCRPCVSHHNRASCSRSSTLGATTSFAFTTPSLDCFIYVGGAQPDEIAWLIKRANTCFINCLARIYDTISMRQRLKPSYPPSGPSQRECKVCPHRAQELQGPQILEFLKLILISFWQLVQDRKSVV